MPESDSSSSLREHSPKALLALGLDPAASSTPPAGVPCPLTQGDEAEMLAASGLFPEFQFESVLSRGGFGVVYLVHHRQMRRRLALKILHRRLTLNPQVVARFEREIQTVAKLDDPGIVRAFDAGQREGFWFLAMEWIDGVDLGAISHQLGQLRSTDACEMIRQASLALHHAHVRGLVHRDVKPTNLMLTALAEVASVKVLDFGLAHLAHSEDGNGDLTLSTEFIGTVDYASPEQIELPHSVDARADIYSLGASLYRLLTGFAPHEQPGMPPASLYSKIIRITRDLPVDVSTRRPDLPTGLAAVVGKMLARLPKDRFQTAEAAADALAGFAAGHDCVALLKRFPGRRIAEAPKNTSPVRRPVARRVFLKRLAVGGLLAAAGGGALVLKSRQDLNQALNSGPGLLDPAGMILGPDGAFYGMSLFGGKFGHGGVFKFVRPNHVSEVIHLKMGPNQQPLMRPNRRLALGADGLLYGGSTRGGKFDAGTLYRFDPRRPEAGLNLLAELNGTNGRSVLAGLIEDRFHSGVFFGATERGGTDDFGTIFRYSAENGITVLADLTGAKGLCPGRRVVSTLIQGDDGMLYGTIVAGGASDGGTAFKVTPDGHFTTLVEFGADTRRPNNPTAGLTFGRDGNLYGTCYYDDDAFGMAFRLTPAGEIKWIARFGPPHGRRPATTLVPAADGTFYGLTIAGASDDYGTIYKMTPEGELTTLVRFTGDQGQYPGESGWNAPLLGADGNLYGATERGGQEHHGTLYRLTPDGKYSLLFEFPNRTHDLGRIG